MWCFLDLYIFFFSIIRLGLADIGDEKLTTGAFKEEILGKNCRCGSFHAAVVSRVSVASFCLKLNPTWTYGLLPLKGCLLVQSYFDWPKHVYNIYHLWKADLCCKIKNINY